MPTYAQTSDVSARLGRPFTTDETTQATALLGDAEMLIKSRIPDLDIKAEDDDYLAIVVMVEANAVARLLRNPEGHVGESDGTYSYQINWRYASGELEITSREWSLLGAGSGMFLINLRVPTPFEGDCPASHPFVWGG